MSKIPFDSRDRRRRLKPCSFPHAPTPMGSLGSSRDLIHFVSFLRLQLSINLACTLVLLNTQFKPHILYKTLSDS